MCRYCAGTMPWGNPGEHHDFEPQRHDDGCLEVIGFTMTSLVSQPSTADESKAKIALQKDSSPLCCGPCLPKTTLTSGLRNAEMLPEKIIKQINGQEYWQFLQSYLLINLKSPCTRMYFDFCLVCAALHRGCI